MIIKVNYKKIVSYLSVAFIICIICSAFTPASIAQSEEGVPLPVIMYHHISADTKALNDYVISEKELEEDLKFLKENGYTAILPHELLKYKNGEFSLPEKPVMITFDDGFESVYHYAYPLFLKYGMKFLMGIYGKEAEHFSYLNDHNILYSYVNWDEIKELAESGICEIANHTYNLHNLSPRKGVKIKKGEAFEEYEKVITGDVSALQNLLYDNCKITPETFVYPYGFSCDESEEILDKMGFKITLSCTEGINYITADSSLKLLKRYNRSHGVSAEKLLKKQP